MSQKDGKTTQLLEGFFRFFLKWEQMFLPEARRVSFPLTHGWP